MSIEQSMENIHTGEEGAGDCLRCRYKKGVANRAYHGPKIPGGFGKCTRPGGLCEAKAHGGDNKDPEARANGRNGGPGRRTWNVGCFRSRHDSRNFPGTNPAGAVEPAGENGARGYQGACRFDSAARPAGACTCEAGRRGGGGKVRIGFRSQKTRGAPLD